MRKNPVIIIETNNWYKHYLKIKEKIKINNPLIVTSNGAIKRYQLDKIFNSTAILGNVTPNPSFNHCQMIINSLLNKNFDGIVAIGGGSVMDTAKVIKAYYSTKISKISELIKIKKPYDNKFKSIFIPTTHGTGSEVTMWGTIWNMKEGKKYSISHPDLFPSYAIIDGSLTTSLSEEYSIISLMDALSHSFESIWNKNANEKSTRYAINAINLIFKNYEKLIENKKDIIIRNNLLKASLLAGKAMSITKTAAAHSISYPLTINFGIPHGIAASMSLLPLLEINKKKIQNSLNALCNTIGTNYIGLVKLITDIPNGRIPFNLSNWNIKKSDLKVLCDQSFTRGRMDNNIVNLSKKDVMLILNKILNE